jgi:hypothetical protein
MHWHKTDKCYITVYVDNLRLYGPPGNVMDPTHFALETEFEVTNIG